MPILLVEDDPVALAAHPAYLRQHGYRVNTAANVESALTRMAVRPWPRCVIVDHVMPGRKGTDFIAYLRDDPHWKHIPAIVVTALADGPAMDELKGELAALQNCKLLRKPFEPTDLLAAVKEVAP